MGTTSATDGRAVLRAYMTLVAHAPSTATARFGATRRAGAATDLGMRIRRHGRLTWRALEHLAAAANVDAADLRLSVAPLMEECGLIDIVREGDLPVAVEEQVGVGAPILEQCSQMWGQAGPTDLEAAAIQAADHCSYTPMARSELLTALEASGFRAAMHDEVLAALRGIGLLYVQPSKALGEDILYSPYVWGTEAVRAAEFMSRLPAAEREVLTRLSREAADRPGTSLENLGVDDKLLAGARKVGLIEATRVITTSGINRAFGFPPGLERRLGAGATDATHERKLFVAHILFGYRYGFPATGRIRDPLLLVSKLIDRGVVGPASSIKSDYPLLEGRGIVRVEEQRDGRAYMHLVKPDIARDSMDLLKLALSDEDIAGGSDSLSSLWVPGAAFRVPEQDRMALPEIEPGATAEVLGATVEHLREETRRKIRGEEF